ncbi:MAG: FAD:protein FMN transferase [Epsilonproteobacteria bacterium]|nr:FAD:protein FMN transferase [Campylobacterota bacterium]
MQYIYKFEAMTTPCEVILFADSKLKADNCAKAILEEAKRLEKKYSYYNSDSLLSKLNQRQTNIVDVETKSLLQRAKQYYTITQGIFDITVATIKSLYHHHAQTITLENEKAKLLPFMGCEHFDIKRDKLIFDNPYTKIDLGGFVKEYAVDRAVVLVKKHKIKSALINFGGDIYALGKKPNGQKFKIGIKDPKDKTIHAMFIEIENEALTTSASYERNYQIESTTYSHILSKEKNINTLNSVTVIAKKCVESGVFSTSLMINPALKTANKHFML